MSALAGAVAARERVDLTELDARAALQTRVDRKYVLPRGEVARVLALLGAEARVLEIDGERWSRYESVYLDTPGLVSYLATAHRRRRRFKVRTRTYLDSGDSFLEVKTRSGRGLTVKERRPCDGPATFGSDDGEHAAAVLAEAVVGPVDPADLAPTLDVTYRRATFLLPGPRGSDARATIDVDVRWAAPDAASARLGLPGLAVVESKTTGHPSQLDRLLWGHGHRPTTISKYGTGLAALRPDLPATRWHRTLHRHVAPSA